MRKKAPLSKSLFNKPTGLKSENFLKERLQHRHLNFARFSRTHFSTSGQLIGNSSMKFFVKWKKNRIPCAYPRINMRNSMYVLVTSRTRFRVNPHSIVAWMSRNSLIEACARSLNFKLLQLDSNSQPLSS